MTKWLMHYPMCVKEQIRGDAFRRFLDICWPYTDCFTLGSLGEGAGKEPCRLRKVLAPWEAGSVTVDQWFGYGPGSSEMRIHRYRGAAGAKEAILDCCGDVYFSIPPEESDRRELTWVEDLCLFSAGKLFFGCISHEKMAYLYPLNAQMRTEVSSLDCWEPDPWRDESDRCHIGRYAWK